MRNEIVKNKEFHIISRNIDNAEKCNVTEVCDDCFKVKLKNKRKYEVDESVEMFAMTPSGQLYFETIVKDVKDDILSIWFPISSKYLQRREFSRIHVDKEILLQDDKHPIKARVFDLSAGGLKITTKEQVELLKEYKIAMTIENKKIETMFQPFRVEAVEDGFIASGRFNKISNFERIALVQYCFRKQIENNTL